MTIVRIVCHQDAIGVLEASCILPAGVSITDVSKMRLHLLGREDTPISEVSYNQLINMTGDWKLSVTMGLYKPNATHFVGLIDLRDEIVQLLGEGTDCRIDCGHAK